MVGAVRADRRADALRPLVLLATWAATIFVFFSASSSKLPGYIVPVYPALAILAAVVVDRLSPRGWMRTIAGTAILASVLAVAAFVAPRFHDAPGFAGFTAWITAGALLAVLGMAIAWRLERNDLRWPSQVAACLALFLGTSVAFVGHEAIGGPASGADLVPRIERVLAPGMPIYSVRLLDHTLPFYLRRTTIMVAGADELEFGVRQEPDKWIPTLQAFERAWTSGRPALAIMSPETYDQLAAEHLPMFRVAADARRVVVANFTPPAS
jgi:4-amino-4-deoxy-L-arabinose transferase-like glycosyltransferase